MRVFFNTTNTRRPHDARRTTAGGAQTPQSWSDCRDSPEEAFSIDELCTNISIYYFGGRIASSMRLYKETLGNR